MANFRGGKISEIVGIEAFCFVPLANHNSGYSERLAESDDFSSICPLHSLRSRVDVCKIILASAFSTFVPALRLACGTKMLVFRN
jgi:hypothetical protein